MMVQDGTMKKKRWDPNLPRTRITKSSNGGVFEEANVVHYPLHEVGLCLASAKANSGARLGLYFGVGTL